MVVVVVVVVVADLRGKQTIHINNAKIRAPCPVAGAQFIIHSKQILLVKAKSSCWDARWIGHMSSESTVRSSDI